MHIPDGYLGPITFVALYVVMIPIWLYAGHWVQKSLRSRQVPYLALAAAFSFVIMMFNVPVPGGSSGHAVGSALVAIILGPWTAVVTTSVALLIQCLLFGDGGVTAFGANCFNMGVVIPYLSYAIYRALSRNTPLESPRRPLAAAFGGWVGVTVGAFFAGVEFGIQPLLFKAADGSPLYAPYPLSVSIPAMVIPHALIASVVEGLLTGLVLVYLQRSNIAVLQTAEKPALAAEAGSFQKLGWLWAGLIVLIVASPLGLLAPGTAWGEWGTDELTAMGLKSVPAGLAQLSNLWGAPMAGYDLPILGNANLGYILSAVVGIAVIAIVVWLFLTLLTRRSGSRANN